MKGWRTFMLGAIAHAFLDEQARRFFRRYGMGRWFE